MQFLPAERDRKSCFATWKMSHELAFAGGQRSGIRALVLAPRRCAYLCAESRDARRTPKPSAQWKSPNCP